jgi:hypothetical protein
MLKKRIKTIVVTATVMALGSTGAFAVGDGKAELNAYDYNVTSAWQTMYVSSSDGDKWDTIEDGTLKFFAHMKIDTKWPGEVGFVGVVLGKCPVELCHVLPILWSKPVFARDFLDQTYISVPTSLLTGSTLELSSERQKIIDACNQHRSAFGATNRHEFQHSLSTTFVADTKQTWGKIIMEAGHDTLGHPPDIDHEKSGDFTFNVVCKPYTPPQDTSDDLQKQEEDEFKTGDIDLFLTTFPNDTHQPKPGLNCPVVHVTTRVTANQVGLAGVDRIAQIDGGAPETAELLIGTSFHPEDGSYSGKQTQKYYLGPNTHARFYARIQSGDVVMSTPWKEITVQCKGPGSGLTTHKDEPMAPPRTLKGDFTFVDHGAPKCTREGKALISFSSNQPGDVHYTLDCTKGQNFSGTAALVKNPAGGYTAAALKSFDVATSTVYSCALKSSAPGAAKLHQWKSHTFKCVHRAVETRPNDVQVDPKPTDDAPRTPAAEVKIAPTPTAADADKKRQEALKKARKAAQKKAEAAKKAAPKAVKEVQRKRAEAAKKAAPKAVKEVQRKRAEAGKKSRKSNTGNAAMQIVRQR